MSVIALAALASCASNPDKQTLAGLQDVPADVEEVSVDDSLDSAMQAYRRFLKETPEGEMTPEALRRLADLEIEKQYGISGDGEIVELPAPQPSETTADTGEDAAAASSDATVPADLTETDEDFEARTTGEYQFSSTNDSERLQLPEGVEDPSLGGPMEAIRIYKKILAEYPSYERNDQVLYQMARAYDEIGQPDEAMAVVERLIQDYGYSRYIDEVQFRRGEYLFTRRRFREAEQAYQAVVDMGASSSYYELALYKLGWALYKQEFYEEALHRFVALLDYKLSIGYDFDEAHEEEDERRVADTYRVISLSFSNLGGPEVVNEYFSKYGDRSYEDRIYSNLGEFYLSKLRYNDAAAAYKAFVDLNPFHRVAPRFGMRVVEIYEQGGFPLLVVESKKDFATKYGLQAEYWDYFDPAESPEVLGYLKKNLTDLANYYHALYQDESLEEDRPANFSEAARWYRAFLSSFPADDESPSINYKLADLLFENKDYEEAAKEYERTAYDYDPHEQASEAGYAAVYARREGLKVASPADEARLKRATVESSLKFADTFPDHEQAAVVLGAATDDLYDMQDFEAAIAAGRKLIERYPEADPSLLRSAWSVVAHSSFELALYADAEEAYTRVLEFVPEQDDARQGLVDNLAASIYKQGEQANENGDYQAAANNFLRIKDVAPTSEIRAAAEYDGASALIRLEEWSRAANVLEEFRSSFPDHELQPEATKELASVYQHAGQLDRSAGEYERVAAESEDPELRREALMQAGDLYEQAKDPDSALDVYVRYVAEFPRPLDIAQETRFKVAGMYQTRGDLTHYHEVLHEIVASDDEAGAERTDRSRYLAAQSALVLSEPLYDQFVEIELTQPFEQSLAEKKKRMDAAMKAFEGLVDYEVADVTAASTYYIAEIYYDFSQSLLNSERPSDLKSKERAEYDSAIEEQAYPFEEQAIDVHERNFELIAAGQYNQWVQRSLDRLGELVPGRYAKHEISSGFIGSIDTYAYRTPSAPGTDVGETAADVTKPKEPPAPADGASVLSQSSNSHAAAVEVPRVSAR
jgi:tetratricopeptide (TPR) repeat protein